MIAQEGLIARGERAEVIAPPLRQRPDRRNGVEGEPLDGRLVGLGITHPETLASAARRARPTRA